MMCFLRIIRKCSKKIDFCKSIIELIGENTDKFSNKTAEAVLFFTRLRIIHLPVGRQKGASLQSVTELFESFAI